MADAQANININLDASQALAQLRALQAEISTFQQKMLKLNASTAASAANVQRNLLNTINATGKFSAGMTTVASSTETFTNSLEKNKFSMGEYFRYAGGASKTFGKLFTNEFNTIEKVARERVKTLQTQYIKLGREANGAMKAISVRPLALDMDNLATKTMIAAQKQQILNQLLRQGSTNLLNWGKNTQWAGRQLMVGFTIPLTIFGSVAAKTFMELEEQAIRFKRVYGELFTTQEETDKMLDQLKALGSEFTKYGVALKDTMAMAADAAAMGKTGVDLLAQVSQASRLAVLGGVEQQQALETTISLTNAFGVATEDLTKKIDFLNAVENQTVVSIEDLTIAIPKAGPVVKQLGGDVEDLAFFLTAMKEGGINASEGANALKSGLASLINPSGKASEMLAGLGININAIVEGNAGDIKGTVIGFAKALDTLDPLNRARAIEQLFGKFQFSRLSTLFQNVVAEGTQASRVLGLTAASTEELAILSERELKRIESSPLFKFRKSFEDLKVAMAPVGEEFLKAVTPIIEFGTKLLEKFNSMSDGGKQFVTILVAGLGVVAPTLLMIIGLVGNGVANIAKFMLFLKGIGKGGAGIQQLGMQTEYMTQQQLEANAAASALSQTHSRLQQAFTSETAAVKALAAAYREAAIASKALMTVPTGRGGAARAAKPTPKATGLAKGILSVPGPKGAGDVVPAMLSPGEAVIPAKQANKYSGFISSIMQDKVPGFFRGVFLGMPKPFSRVAQNRTESDLIASRFIKDPKIPVAKYGHQIEPTSGRSFPIPGVGGVYAKADGSKVFVKPFTDKQTALAEMRASEIARKAHGLLAPQHTMVRIPDPTDMSGKRTFYALESKLDPTFANPTGKFTKGEMVKQLLASLVRADKDLSPGNMFGRVLTDPGPAGVFSKASGYRDFAKPGELPSLAQQAEINLLGVKGGARKFFAQSTSDMARSMTPKQYQDMMIKEIDTVLPKLKQTIAGFNLKGSEKAIYDDMIKRLEAGRNVDWTRFHKMHSDVPALPPRPLELAEGIFSVPGPKGAGDVVPAMLSPGEAVIPEKQSRKHASFIQSIIADKVPGYYGGLFSQTMMRLAQKQAASMKLPAGASSKTDEAVVAFGAHQPFTIAHQRIADQGMALASSQQSRFMQFTTEAFGKSKRHVLPLSTKLKLIKESLGFPATAVANPFALMEKLKSQGISKVTMMLGTDRMSSRVFDEAAAKYGITLVKKEIPRGPNDVSGTETRIAIAKNDKAKFDELIASRASDPTKNQVFKEIAQNIKGYNNGVLSVPGPKGAGDVVPAMLSPGEAVIPAKQSQKYAGFIQSIISDNVPGFKGGRSGSGAEGRIGKSNFTVMRNYSANVSNTSGLAGFTGIGGQADVASAYAPQIAKAAGVSVDSLNKEITNWSNTNKKLIDDATKQFRKTGDAQTSFAKVSEKFNKDMVSAGGPVSKFMSAAKTNFKQFNTDLKQAQAYAKANNIDVRAKGGAAQLAKALPGNIAAQSMATPKAFGSFAKIRGATSSMFAGGNLGKMGVPSFMLPQDLWTNRENKDLRPISSSQEHVAATNKQIAARKSETKATTEGTETTKKNTAAKDKNTTAVKKSTRAEAKPKTTGATNNVVSQSQGSSVASRIETKVNKSGQTYYVLDGKRISEDKAKTAFANQERARRGAETREAKRVAEAAAAAKRSESARKAAETRARNRADRLAAAPPVAQGGQRAGARGGMGMGGVGMLAMTAGMMAPMLPGKAGEIGGQLAGPLMALGMLSMLPPKIAIVVGALALLGISIYSMINAFSKSAKEMMTLTENLGAGSKSIAQLSEFAGTVSAGELMDRRRESMFTPYQIQPGKTTFGSSFVQSEQGTAMIESMKTALKSQGMQAVQSQVINQMSTAIATGALNPDQARSIIYELGKQLGDYSFGISVNGKLSQLIGPNGENLLTDPLGIRLKIMQESIDATQDSLEAMDTSKVGFVLGGKIAAGIGISTATTLGGAALGAKIGAAIGTAAAPGVGTAIGAAAGVAVGVGITALMTVKDFEKIGNLSGAVIANSVMLVQQRQQILDSLDVEYEKRISAAKAAGDVAKADELTNQYLEERQQFLSSTGQAISDVAKQIADAPSFLGLFGEKNALMSTLDEAVKMAYADNPLAQLQATGTQEQIKDIDFGNTEREITLSLLLASKDIDPAALSGFLAAFGDDTATVDTFINIATNLGGAEGGRVLQVMNLFDDDVNKTQFLADVKVRGTNAKGFLDAFQQIAQVEAGGQVDIQTSLDFYLNNPEILADYEADMQRLREQAEVGDIRQDFIIQYIGQDVADIIATDQEYFDGLPPSQQVTYVQTVRTIFETYGEDYRETEAFKSWNASQKSDVPDEAFFTQSANQLTAAEALAQDMGEMEDVPSGGSKSKKTSPLDDILKKLRDYRQIQIGILEGWQAISNRINELFGAGGLSGFTGLAQQMRSLGAGENLIQLIVGMDPDEYEKRKDELFVFDEKGNIAVLTNQAVNLGRALNAITLGEFVNEQQQTLRNFKNQIMATRTLTNAGLSLADAYELAGDAALAAAIVAEKNLDNIRQMVALAKETKKISEDVASAQAVAQKNQSQDSLNNILSFMKTAGKAFTDAQKTAILGDEDLQKLVLDPAIDPKTLRTALANAEKQASLQVNIKKLTFEGLQEIFSDGFSKAMESFSVKEQQINLKFNVSKKPFEDIIKANQEIIEDIINRAGGLDDLRADLDRISFKEKDINDKYDLRIKALNKINEINQKISNSQKSQIDIADALSRGDIAAAARAVEEQRSQNQQNAVEQQMSALAQQKESELSGLRNSQGQTRLEIQKQILEIERQIFEIEESAIEPAQRQIALLERQQQVEIESLTVLGRTRLEWEEIKNRVDLAVIGTDQFKQAMEEALGVVTDIVTYWNDFTPTEKDLFVNVRQRLYDVDEPEGVPGPDPGPDPDDGPGDGTKDPPTTPPTWLSDFNAGLLGPRNQGEFSALDRRPVPTPYFPVPGTTGGPMSDPRINSSEQAKVLQDSIKNFTWSGFLESIFGKPSAQTTSSAPSGLGSGGSGGFGAGGAVGTSAGNRSLPPFPGSPQQPTTSGVGPTPMLTSGMGTTLLKGFQSSFNTGTISKIVQPALKEGVETNMAQTAERTPTLFQRFTSFLSGDVPATAKRSISSGISEPLRLAGQNAPTQMGPLDNYFLNLSSRTAPQINSAIKTPLDSIGTNAPTSLSGIPAFFTNLVPKTKKDLETTIPGQFGTLKTSALTELDNVDLRLSGMSDVTKEPLETTIPDQFTTLNTKAMENIKPVDNFFSTGLAEKISAAFNTLPIQFKIAMNKLIDLINKLKITIPATIGGIPIPLVGGKSFGFNVAKLAMGGEVKGYPMGGLIPYKAAGGLMRYGMGGSVKGYPMGGLIPYKAEGGFFKSLGSDTVPAMLTPGEFVVRRPAVKGFGVKNLEKINRGTYGGSSMYNYNLEVNVKSDSSPEQIASTVMRSIRQVEGRRIRGNNL